MQESSVAKRNNEGSVKALEETRAGERYIRPAVNIIETEDGLTLVADIPGAEKNTLDINIEKGILTLNAPVSRSMMGRLLYTEFEFPHYYRQFSIPENLDNDQVKAELRNGVLTLKVPLAAAAKPRKIEVKAS